MTVLILSHPDCRQHVMGAFHPECPERIEVIDKSLNEAPFSALCQFESAPLASKEALYHVHAKDYVDQWFARDKAKDYGFIDPDTQFQKGTLQAALRAAGSVVEAVDRVQKGEFKKVFCNVRPPGHHAEHQHAMGFCFFNNIAVGAAHALDAYQLERIAIIDIDVHQGNGTQDIFFNDPRVLFCSSYEHPFYPHSHGETNEHMLHALVPAGTTGETWRHLVTPFFDAIKQFRPQMIFVSAGFDAHIEDPLAYLRLTDSDYAWMAEKLCALSHEVCEGKLIATLEGGYHLEALANSARKFVGILASS